MLNLLGHTVHSPLQGALQGRQRTAQVPLFQPCTYVIVLLAVVSRVPMNPET